MAAAIRANLLLVSHREAVIPIDPAFPRAIKAQIERALDTQLTSIVRHPSGSGGGCYVIAGPTGHWVARLDVGSNPRLRKSVRAQQQAASAGVRVPAIIAAQVAGEDPEGYNWTVEEYVRGDEFYPARMDPSLRKPTSADIGRQLRLLHSVEVSGFGDLTRDLRDAPHATWAGWVDQQEAHVEDALRIAACRAPEVARIRNAYRVLKDSYRESPKLCHGDFSDDNLLVQAGSLIGVVDWECALAGDPASDVAYWFMWHEDGECLEGLLAAYAPADLGGFRERVAAHGVLSAVKFICWFRERHDRAGVEHCRRILRSISAYP